jgi:hypothetical protein
VTAPATTLRRERSGEDCCESSEEDASTMPALLQSAAPV